MCVCVCVLLFWCFGVDVCGVCVCVCVCFGWVGELCMEVHISHFWLNTNKRTSTFSLCGCVTILR